MGDCWDAEMTRKLVGLGLTREQARNVIGVMVEDRQQADLQGYHRGFQDGVEREEQRQYFLEG